MSDLLNAPKQSQIMQSYNPGDPVLSHFRVVPHIPLGVKCGHLYRGLLEKPICVTPQNLGDLLLHLLSGHSDAIDNPAEIGFIDAYQPC